MQPKKCTNCDAHLSHHEVSEGWCDTCGKRLPGSWLAVKEDAFRKPEFRPPSGLARLASWLTRLSAAGMLFVLAGCVGLPVWGSLVFDSLDMDTSSRQIGSGLGVAFFTFLTVWLIGKGLAVLADKETSR